MKLLLSWNYFTRVNYIKKILSGAEKNEHIDFYIIRFFCVMIVLFFPTKYWYKIAFRITWFFKIYYWFFNKNLLKDCLIRSVKLNRFLSLLTRAGVNFHIPYTIKGTDLLNHSSGILLATTHLPLSKVGIKAILEKPFKVEAAIVAKPTIINKMSVWGSKQKIKSLKTEPFVLLKSKRILLNKGCLVLMIDNVLTKDYSPNSLRLCKITGSKLVFFFAQLTPNGVIHIELFYPPSPFCESERAIEANLNYLKSRELKLINENIL